MSSKIYGTTEVSMMTGNNWHRVAEYARRNLLPTAKLSLKNRKKKGRWEYTDEDVRLLKLIRFYRVQGYEFWVAYDKAVSDYNRDKKNNNNFNVVKENYNEFEGIDSFNK
jgi:DNA-binding transcriptional MerR regulator